MTDGSPPVILAPTAVAISVIVPSYNSGAYLREALASALDQSTRPYEVLVQDGGSTDGTLEILRSLGDQVDWVSEKDGGQSDAVNRALSRSTGDVIVWLNADDRVVPGAFSAIEDAFRKDPGLAFVYGNFDMINARGEPLRHYRSRPYSWSRVFDIGCYIFSGSIAVRREVLLALGGYDESLHAVMDFDMLLRLGSAGRSLHLGVTIGQLRRHEAAKSSRIGLIFLREALRVRRRYADGSPRRWAVVAFALARSVVLQVAAPLRFSRLWSHVRREKVL